MRLYWASRYVSQQRANSCRHPIMCPQPEFIFLQYIYIYIDMCACKKITNEKAKTTKIKKRENSNKS